ncbi:MAG: hypothetical protein M1814_001316 [Vezdaea aestivalis]|nr:MAG: hypothetical protein M1814_001316 [Vezdaea aestivalis]
MSEDPSSSTNTETTFTKSTDKEWLAQRAVDDIIKIYVEPLKFNMSLSSLTEESLFFGSLLSGRWSLPRTSDDTALVVNSKPEVFEHIFNHIQRGICPIFYDKTKGFDYGLYQIVLGEAKYFGVERLGRWIESKGFEKAVFQTITWTNYTAVEGTVKDNVSADIDIRQERLTRRMNPRPIFSPLGDPSLNPYVRFGEEEYVQTTVISRKTVWDLSFAEKFE